VFVLKVWRPVNASEVRHYHYHGGGGGGGDAVSSSLHYYSLVGQTFFRPTELRFQELTLMPHQLIAVRRGDLLGLHAARFNPLAWTAVPCGADRLQRYRYAVPGTPGGSTGAAALQVGRTLAFQSAAADESCPCRQYSFTALFGELSEPLQLSE